MTSNASVGVSFIVPCYNYAQFLPDCLNSIFRQQGDFSFEVIAIDDASTDNTVEVLEKFADQRLRVIRHSTNRGHVKTISRGLAEARGEFVARIDPDDRYRPYFLCETMPRFQRYPEVALVYGDAALIDSEGQISSERTDKIHHGGDFKGNEFVELLMENFVCAPTVIARRKAWLEALPLPANLAFNDWYFNLMIARKHDFYFISRVLAEYRVHSANHHTMIIRNRSEEPSIIFLLDKLFEQTEDDPVLERAKIGVKGKVYGAQYLTLADKYFGLGMTKDARRCYLLAMRYSSHQFFNLATLRRFIATWIDPQTYKLLKRVLWRVEL